MTDSPKLTPEQVVAHESVGAVPPSAAVPMLGDSLTKPMYTEIGPREIAAFDEDLSYLHKQRWARRADELERQLEAATGEERAAIDRQLDAHYDNRFKPETSRDAIIAQAKANVAARQHGG